MSTVLKNAPVRRVATWSVFLMVHVEKMLNAAYRMEKGTVTVKMDTMVMALIAHVRIITSVL